MAGAGYRNWTAGDVPTATQFDTFLQEQTVMVFASAAARDTALSVAKAEGMVAFLLDLNTLTVYSGSVWSTVGPVHGALTSWTPTVAQGVGITVTNQYSRYTQLGRLITGWFAVTCTTAGTAGQLIVVDMPADSVATDLPCGVATYLQVSSGLNFQTVLIAGSSGGVINFEMRVGGSATDPRMGVGVGITVANGDVIRGQFAYETNA